MAKKAVEKNPRFYSIEFLNKNTETEENYDVVSKIFERRYSAIRWVRRNFCFISKQIEMTLVTYEGYYCGDGVYDICEIKREKVHIRPQEDNPFCTFNN